VGKNYTPPEPAGVTILILLDLKTTPTQVRQAPQKHPTAIARVAVHRPVAGSKILRFYRSERMLHWAITIPFLVCYATALVLVTVYNPAPHRPLRLLFSWAHRASGIALAVLPLLAALGNRREYRIHCYNVKEAWVWGRDDFKWLFLMPLAALSGKFKLPEQGKFNAAEKVNFMVLMGTYPLYITTGLLIWLKTFTLAAWALHLLMAAIATPLILGHMYMAMIDRGGRPGLTGMISGYVDREWAKHHYPRWYREFHEPEEDPAE
jgi:formate dehydrogenase subunit gamma